MRRMSIGVVAAAAAALVGGAGVEDPVPTPKPRKAVRRPQVSMNPTPAPTLNRSNKWDYAASYKDARAISPYPNRPVR